jgi:hypothetical protein
VSGVTAVDVEDMANTSPILKLFLPRLDGLLRPNQKH